MVKCDYCGKPADLITGADLYPHRQDLWNKKFYSCSPCLAYVGCHPGTKKPLGVLANAEHRAAKGRAHRAFDQLWKDGKMSRTECYAWLSKEMGKLPKNTHIGMFTIPECDLVVKLVNDYITGKGGRNLFSS